MNNIFYHLFCGYDGPNRFFRTYNKIIKTNLINHIENIFVVCVGPDKEKIRYNKLNYLQKVIPSIGINDHNESSTLNIALEYAKTHINENTLYLHSKGVIRTRNKDVCIDCIQDWIDCMEYFLIEEHINCLDILTKYDTCGVNLGRSHYSGNFWWSTNKYLATRPVCKNMRMFCELNFLQPTNTNNRHKQLHSTKIQWPLWLTNRYPRKLYTQKAPVI